MKKCIAGDEGLSTMWGSGEGARSYREVWSLGRYGGLKQGA